MENQVILRKLFLFWLRVNIGQRRYRFRYKHCASAIVCQERHSPTHVRIKLADCHEGDSRKGQSLNLLKSCGIVKRKLWLKWSIPNDLFQIKIVFKNLPLTWRGILSLVSVIYDPLGFLAPVILMKKRILQYICQQQFDLETQLPLDIIRRWETWKNDIAKLEALLIQWCYNPNDYGEVT